MSCKCCWVSHGQKDGVQHIVPGNVQVTVDWKAKHSSETHKAVEWVRPESVPVCLKRSQEAAEWA